MFRNGTAYADYTTISVNTIAIMLAYCFKSGIPSTDGYTYGIPAPAY